MRRLLAIAVLVMGGLTGLIAWGQQPQGESLIDRLARATALDAEEQRNGLVAFLENQISTPDRQIRLSNIEGALSSNASIGQITISDREGIWLIVENAAIDWNQGALLFGRLEINALTADSIAYIRNPVAEETSGAPSPEATGFQVPEFPVAIILNNLSVPSISFGEQVFGLGSQIALEGAMTLDGGAIDAALDITRLDGPGGALGLDLVYSNQTREIDLGLLIEEPQNGILANLLNIEGRPPIAVALDGAGPIEDLGITLAFDADGQRILSGTGTLNETDTGLAIHADIGGPLAEVLPAPYRDFFGTQTALVLDATMRNQGGFLLDSFALSGGQLALTASGEIGADGFPTRLEIDGGIASSDNSPVILPVPGASTTISTARFAVDFGTAGSEDWTGILDIEGFSTPDFAASALTLNASGVAAGLETPDQRRVTFNADGQLSGITTADPAIAEALGQTIGLGAAGLWETGAPITLAQFRLLGEALSLEMAGEIADAIFTGNIALSTSSLAPFSGVAGRPLAGRIAVSANGDLMPLSGGFDLTLDGQATNLALGDDIADALLQGEARLSGRLARTGEGFAAENFFLGNNRIALTADGTYATGAADFAFNLDLADIGLVAEDASGPLTARGTATGSEGTIALDLDASVPQGRLAGRTLTQATLGFNGTTSESGLIGAISGNAFLDGFRVTLAADLDNTPDRLALSDIAFSAPGATLSGNLIRSASGLLDGRLTLDAPDVSTAAALLATEARGQLDADITLSPSGETQSLAATLSAARLSIPSASIGAADIDLSIADLFGVPVIDGTISGTAISASGVDIETLALTANATGDTTRFQGTAALANAANVALAGSLAPQGEGFALGLDALSLTQGSLSARLASPTTLVVANEAVAFSGVDLLVGSGRITATGSAGQNLDIALTVSALPLNIANAIAPDLALAGTVSGNARITGAASDPRASFSVEASGINAAALAPVGIAPLSLTANGTYADNTVTLASARATGAGGLSATASGAIPLSGSGLDLTVNGTAPLTLANRILAERGAQASGTLTVNAQVRGSLASPNLTGTASLADGDYIDPDLALRLTGITGSAALSGDTVTINTLNARLATGGGVSVTGSVRLDAPAFTSDLAILLDNARYADGNLVVATLNGRLALTGPMMGGGTLSGTVTIESADITLPEAIGGAGAAIDVAHINTPADVSATLARARVDERGASTATPAPALNLDLNIVAPNQVFLRGRGLDAELGGAIRLTGSAAAIQPVGGLELIRGRLSILGQRIDFESGTLTLIGDLDPFVDLVARTQGEDITVYVTVSGRVSAPQVDFSSDPMLPQDEVLARLIFNRSVGELSPLQVARLAAAAAELAGGGGGGGLVDDLRRAAGLDDLDIITDSEGNAALRAGRYIDDNIYLGVEAGAAESRVTIDLGVTENVTARGSTSTSGDSSLGIFYEQDY